MKLVILDRDGVINQDSDQFIKTPDEWIPGCAGTTTKNSTTTARIQPHT